MILKLIFLCLLSFAKCLEEMPHACLNVTLSQYYCWSDFEEKDGKCVGCETGFTSDVGQPENAVINFMAKDVYPNANVRTMKNRSESVTIYETTITGSTESTGPHNGFQLELLVYSASVTGVILILGIRYLCKKYKTRRKKSKSSVTLDEDITQNDPPNESHEAFELSEGLYHTIDEDKILVSSTNDNPYLEVVNGSSGSDSIKNDKGETASYPPPYCRQITTSVDKHPYENSRPESFDSHAHISGTQETDEGYLTPSKPIIDSSIRCETEIFAMVHVETYSSSGSDNEKNDKNDGIDYLNPYQPLEKCNQTEKDHGYDILMTGPIKLTLDNVITETL